MAKQWEEMTSVEKQEELFARWISPEGVEFVSPETEKAYKERVTRIKDAIQLKKLPDRVPIFPNTSFFPAFYAGITPQEAMYDYDKCNMAWKKYVLDFEPDAHGGMFVATPGKVLEILDYKLYSWPGHGVPPQHSYQYNEGEYMKADEYDAFIEDPSNFYSNIYLPRIYGALEHFTALSFSDVLEMYGAALPFIPFGVPPVQAAYKALFEAGAEALKWIGVAGAFNTEMAAAGFPVFWGGAAKAPFDMIGDTLRGTKGIMVDMYRQPDKLLRALEVMTPLVIKMGVSAAKMNGHPITFIPLHKGADGFLSDEQYKKFYWPTFRKLLMGIIDEGIIPLCYAEGGYNSRLEIIGDLPRGRTIWSFDTTDMAKAKEILGDVACIGGNMPSDLLAVGTPQQVKDYARKLIDTVGKGGGYIMITGVSTDQAKPENLHAMIDFTKEYGVYK